MRLLVIDRDDRSANYVLRGLTESGHVVDRLADGDDGLVQAQEGIYDVLIVDRHLPDLDGVSLVRGLRASGNATPVLMLGKAATLRDKVDGLQAGCDDYLAKPYAFAELLARIEALGRRARRSYGQAILEIGDLRFDMAGRRAWRGGREIELQYRECLILDLMMRHAGHVVTRAMLLEAAWDYDTELKGNFIEKHIYRLRRKIDRDHAHKLIRTVPRAGYMLVGI